MSRQMFVVVLRVDALDEPEDGFDTENYLEVYGPFLSLDEAEAFVTTAEEEMEIRVEDGGRMVYGRVTFHAQAVMWHEAVVPSWNDTQYNAVRASSNWVYSEEEWNINPDDYQDGTV